MVTKKEMKNCNRILKEKQQKYQHYNQTKLTNINILHAKRYYLLIKVLEKISDGVDYNELAFEIKSGIPADFSVDKNHLIFTF